MLIKLYSTACLNVHPTLCMRHHWFTYINFKGDISSILFEGFLGRNIKFELKKQNVYRKMKHYYLKKHNNNNYSLPPELCSLRFSRHIQRKALIVYRFIDMAPIGNVYHDPFLISKSKFWQYDIVLDSVAQLYCSIKKWQALMTFTIFQKVW